MTQLITVSQAGPIARVVLNDGGMNLFTFELVKELRAACIPLLDSKHIRVVVLESGLKHVWSAGADLREFVDADARLADIAGWYYDVWDLASRFVRSDTIVVAALSRTVVGVAAALALSCDFRLMSNKANFYLPEAKLGLVAPLFSADLLSLHAGLETTKRLLLECAKLTAHECLSQGLASMVVDFDGFSETLSGWVSELAHRDPLPVLITKRHLARHWDWTEVPLARETFIEDANEGSPGHWGDFLDALKSPVAQQGIADHLGGH